MAELTTREVLVRARDLIADPERWAQNDYARVAGGASAEPNDPDACQWCAIGAVLHVQGKATWEEYDDDPRMAWSFLNACALAAGYTKADDGKIPAVVLNDSSDHATVLKMFACAIEKAS